MTETEIKLAVLAILWMARDALDHDNMMLYAEDPDQSPGDVLFQDVEEEVGVSLDRSAVRKAWEDAGHSICEVCGMWLPDDGEHTLECDECGKVLCDLCMVAYQEQTGSKTTRERWTCPDCGLVHEVRKMGLALLPVRGEA